MGSRWGMQTTEAELTVKMGIVSTVVLCWPICENQAYNMDYTPTDPDFQGDREYL